jgi:NTP pyrophosphatase (non-canonical NTP hydrolase)
MSEEEYKKSIAAIVEHYGFNCQSRQLFEEMGELTVAINKWWRCDGSLEERSAKRANIVEELADVQIMLDQMIYFLCCYKEVEDVKQAKIWRQLKRMESEEK